MTKDWTKAFLSKFEAAREIIKDPDNNLYIDSDNVYLKNLEQYKYELSLEKPNGVEEEEWKEALKYYIIKKLKKEKMDLAKAEAKAKAQTEAKLAKAMVEAAKQTASYDQLKLMLGDGPLTPDMRMKMIELHNKSKLEDHKMQMENRRMELEKEVNSHKKEFALEFNRSHGKSHQQSSFNRDNASPMQLKFGDDETKENNMQAQIEPPVSFVGSSASPSPSPSVNHCSPKIRPYRSSSRSSANMMKKRKPTSFSRRSNGRSYPESSRPLVHLTQRKKTAISKKVFSVTSNPDASVSFAGASIFNLGKAPTSVQSNSSISGKI